MFGAFRLTVGEFDQVAVRVAAVERSDRALGAAALDRAGNDLDTAGLEVGRHALQGSCGEEAKVGRTRRGVPRHRIVRRGVPTRLETSLGRKQSILSLQGADPSSGSAHSPSGIRAKIRLRSAAVDGALCEYSDSGCPLSSHPPLM